MKESKYTWIFGLLITGFIIVGPIILLAMNERQPARSDPWANVPQRRPHVDHTSLIEGPFETGSDVTRRCLECHEKEAHDFMQTVHWTWESEPVLLPGRNEPVTIGKKNQLNNFCLGIQSNWVACTRCHAGYGYENNEFDFSDPEKIDCLVCHEQTGAYKKSSFGYVAEGVDLVAAAQSVGTPTRQNCGGCHFNGGGGNAVKHGDLDSSLYFPTENVDVHMGRFDFQCVDCHWSENHQIMGHAISVSIDSRNALACTDCHDGVVHEDARITAHLGAVACQTCHVPQGAIRDATKMSWDWSTAGQDFPEDPHIYLKMKGSFVYEKGFTPVYTWFNGSVDRYILGDVLDPTQTLVFNQPHGSISDPTAKIWPFKVHTGRQIYDTQYNYLIQPQVAGKEGFWTTFDWDLSARRGMAVAGLPYSGEYGFVDTAMYWSLTHLVQPKEKALQCHDCHGENGRMDWEALGYYGDPMRWGGRTLRLNQTAMNTGEQ